MWTYDRTLEYPVNITKPNAKLAKVIISQFGGPDGELGASQRYLSQRYSNGDKRVCGILTDIGTEEPVRPPGGALLRITRLRARRLLCGKTI